MTAVTDSTARRPGIVWLMWRRTGFAPLLLLVLLVLNVVLNPVRFAPGNWGSKSRSSKRNTPAACA